MTTFGGGGSWEGLSPVQNCMRARLRRFVRTLNYFQSVSATRGGCRMKLSAGVKIEKNVLYGFTFHES